MADSDITLESPFPTYALPRIWAWVETFRDKVFDDFGPQTREDFVTQWLDAERRGRRSWAVIRRNELGGVITASSINPVVSEMHCIFRKEFWGHATTVPALTQIYELLISEGAEKVTACVAADNHGLIALMKRVGGKREGVLERHLRRKGKPCDLLIMALHKEDFYGRRDRTTDVTRGHGAKHRDAGHDGAGRPGQQEEESAGPSGGIGSTLHELDGAPGALVGAADRGA